MSITLNRVEINNTVCNNRTIELSKPHSHCELIAQKKELRRLKESSFDIFDVNDMTDIKWMNVILQ